MAEGADVPGRYRYEWALFADWCAAADLAALPASPLAVAVFLAENPAGDAAQRRRVAVVNRVHTAAGYSAPGTVTAIRLQLDRARTDRAAVLRGRVAPIIAALPVVGWPTGMFGRRDAVILALYAAGLRAVDVSRSTGGTSPSSGTVLCASVVQEHPSTRVLEQHLRAGAFPDPDDDVPGVSGPVVVPIDRWGAVPLPPTAMTPAAITSVVTSHLVGTPARHRPLPARPGPRRSSAEPWVVPGEDASELSDTYAAGVAARSAAHTALADVGDVLHEVEDRAEELLRRTLALLDDL